MEISVTPTEPRTENMAPGWQRVCYAENQPQYLPLPSLQNAAQHGHPVISMWTLDDGEIALMKAMIESHAGGGPRPRISLTLWTFGGPLQPILLQVGESGAPYMQRAPGPPNPPRSTIVPVG
jgi:hypothetical protein